LLQKYYPPDFDPSNIPRMKTQKNRPFNIRIMAPMNMRCNTCGEYIYKGKKFNSRKEDVEDEFYLGLRIFRFYIKCPRCVSEIAFKTDLENTDYTLEAGATRLFEAEKLARQMAEEEIKAKEDEELNNPMKVLENRTKASRNEIEQIDALEELREMNSRHAKLDHGEMLKMHAEYEKHLSRLQEEEDEKEIRSIFGEAGDGQSVKRLHDDEDDDHDGNHTAVKRQAVSVKATDILTQDSDEKTTLPSSTQKSNKKPEVWEKSVGGLGSKNSLKNLVRKKVKSTANESSSNTNISMANGSNPPSAQKTNDDTSAESRLAMNSAESSVNEKLQSKDQPNDASKCPVVSTGNSRKTDLPQTSVVTSVTKTSSLGLLGNYSDSESNEDSE
ncbi:hypothetical protein FSP39_013015, partial [Pinctada imbricata]